jgi:hypothetical protein
MGRIPFDPDAVKAVNEDKSIVDMECKSGYAVKEIYTATLKELFR